MVQRIQTAGKQKHAGRRNRRGGDQAAAMYEDYGRCAEENHQAKSRRGAQNSWWVSELLAAACQRVWLRPEREDTMQHFYYLLHEKKKKKDEEQRVEEDHQKLVDSMISSAEVGAGFLH